MSCGYRANQCNSAIPYLRVSPSAVVVDLPVGASQSPDPEALHVDDGAGRDDQLPVVALSDLTVGVPEQDGRRLLGGIVELLAEPDTDWSGPVPVASNAAPPERSLQHVLA